MNQLSNDTFLSGSVTSGGNENCTTTSYQIGPNFGRAHDPAQWSPLGLRQQCPEMDKWKRDHVNAGIVIMSCW